MTDLSRRSFLGSMAASAALPHVAVGATPQDRGTTAKRPLRVRTLTAGIGLTTPADLTRIEAAVSLLGRAKKAFEADGYQVQTVRIATTPFLAEANEQARDRALASLRSLDALAAAGDVRVSIGPVLMADRADSHLPKWVTELVRSTKTLNLSMMVASPQRGPARLTARVAAETMLALSQGTPGGVGNFRFAAIANVPPGTPFFPAGFHEGPDSLAVGLESASLVEEALTASKGRVGATDHLRDRLNQALAPVEQRAAAIAKAERCVYLGIDPSPAPGIDRSIGAALEAFTGVPFGSASTLEACATVTAALKTLRVRTCGYAGLMLPVLEDPVLARRASEGRYTVQDILLYSSVCGTGLDVVPIPGDTPVDVVARLIGDVATLASRLQKPLSARLFPTPGKKAGEVARFDDPFLTESTVFPLR